MPEIQQELFNDVGGGKRRKKFPFRPREPRRITLTFTLDAFLLGLLLLVMGLVLLYAVGMEVGRRERVLPSSQKALLQEGPRDSAMPAAPTPPPAPEKRFTVQIASFRTAASAEQAVTRMRGEIKNQEVFLIPGTRHIAVCAGVFDTHAEADRALEVLRRHYADAFVRNR